MANFFLMKYYLLIFLLLGSLFLSGQVSDISIAEKTAFSKILLANKTKAINTDSMVIKALLDSGMSEERYAEILKSGFNGEKIALTDKDRISLSAIQQVSQDIKSQETSILTALCQKEGISYNRYNQILKIYKGDISFQQSLLPFINQIITTK